MNGDGIDCGVEFPLGIGVPGSWRTTFDLDDRSARLVPGRAVRGDMSGLLGASPISDRLDRAVAGETREVRWRSVEFWQGRWPGYAVAIGSVGLAALCRDVLTPVLGDRGPFILFFPALLAAAGVGGLGPGVVALLLSATLGWALSAGNEAQALAHMLLFTASGVGVLLLASLLARWRWRALKSETAAAANNDAAMRVARELELLIDGATNYAIYMLNPEGRVTIWNEGAERIKGWRECEILGRHTEIFYPPEEVMAGKPAADLARAQAEGKFEEESGRVRKDGTEFLASVTITTLTDETGRHIGFGKVIRDVTEQRAAEGVLEAREQQLRSILATVPDAMIVIDDAGSISSFSAAAERLFGWREQEIVGSRIETLMPEPDRSRHAGYLSHYLTTGERRIIGTTRRVMGARKDGSVFPLELSIGEAIGGGQRMFTGFIRDLSAKEETEERVRQLQSELTHVSRLSAMGTMASTLAHELNQPIAAVANYVEASRDLLADPDDDTLAMVREALTDAASEAFRAGNIVRRLRAFVSRGELDKRVEELGPLVDEAATLGLAGATERNVQAHIEIGGDAGPVLVDRVQIQQVLVNLMRNAIEAMAASRGGTLCVNATSDQGYAHVIVADNGPGLAPEVADRLFEAFASTKREGMGLGLSICRTIVEAHGGRIWTESREGGGTEFHFTLPKASMEVGDGR
jgi:two-component system sensor kinase FixL